MKKNLIAILFIIFSFSSFAQKYEITSVEWNWLDKERINGLTDKISIRYNEDEDSDLVFSRLVEDSVGFIQAGVSLSDDNLFNKVKIYGDFYADAEAIRQLEKKLKSTPAQKRSVALVIDGVLGSSEHVIMGIKRLGSILEAIMDAVSKVRD